MFNCTWKLAVVVLVSSLALAGCGKKKEAAPDEAASTSTAVSPAINMQEGEWEITTKVEMPDIPGMPAGAMMSHTVKSCLSKENYIPEASREQSDCKVENQTIDGNTVNWTVVCKETTSKGSVTYAGDTMNGVMESKTKAEGREINSKITMSGKRIGACPAR
jgi:hypothetical protein